MITSLNSSFDIHDIHAIATRGFRIYTPFRNSCLAPARAALAKSNHDPSGLVDSLKYPDMRDRRRISAAESISLSSAKWPV